MISTAELHRAEAEQGLRFDQAEKDYVILWVLSALTRLAPVRQNWVFKGGTCLRHCYYTGYRFSEDLDFSCRPVSGNLEESRKLLQSAADEVERESGIRMGVKDPLTPPGDFQIEFPLEYSRGGLRRRGLPQVKVHLTFDEPILEAPVLCVVTPTYSDLSSFEVPSYSKREIIAEKLRALLQQQQKWPRPRDLYDLWHILCRSGEKYAWEELQPLFVEKCHVRGVAPDRADLVSEKLMEWTLGAWEDRLGPMLKELPDLAVVWEEWTDALRRM